MTQFEFLSIAGSIIFALSVGRLVGALPYLLRSNEVSPLMVSQYAALFLMQLLLWWGFWDLREVTTWDIPGYLLFIGIPVAYYLATFILVSDEPSGIASWADHYEANGRWFCGALTAAWAIGFGNMMYIDRPGTSAVAFSALTLAVFASGSFTNNRYLH